MACSLPSSLHPATRLVSLGSSSNSLSLEGRQQERALLGEGVWRRTRRKRWPLPLTASINNAEAASTSSADPADKEGPPIIELQFLSPESSANSQTLSTGSGEKNLRKFMLESNLEVYAFYNAIPVSVRLVTLCGCIVYRRQGKMMNCGGGGSCGTCIVQILEGSELLSERTDAEYKHLKKKPDDWRLSCQVIVGDKSNSGKVVVQRLPQKK